MVPVLSEAMTVVDPSVSKLSNFLTYTYLLANLFATITKLLVTVAGSPYGTLAIITRI